MSGSRTSPFRGQGTSGPRQMGLLLDMSLDGEVEPWGREEELEAELLSLLGERGAQGNKVGGAAPVPMVDIERMAALCMKDLDEEEEAGDEQGDLESDADLLAELNEVLVEGEVEKTTPTQHSNFTVSGSGGLESRLIERIDMYQTAISNAKAARETSKARRYERGLKTLQSMLSSVQMGKPVNEEEIPPPVATSSRPTSAHQTAESTTDREQAPRVRAPVPSTNECLRQGTPPTTPKLRPPPSLQKASAISPGVSPASTLIRRESHNSNMKDLVLARQREYKLAAVQAKQLGDLGMAKCHYLMAKKLDTVVEAFERGDLVDISTLPPPPGDVERQPSAQLPASQHAAPLVSSSGNSTISALPAPRSVAEALQQRMQRYKAAAEDAKSKGEDRKARMHLRIVMQYQDAIRSHNAGRPASLSELPVPPGCPPLQGSESGVQSFTGVLETALKLANQDADEEKGEEQGEEVPKPSVKLASHQAKAPAPPSPSLRAPGAPSQSFKLGPKAQQQLDFLLVRRQQFVRAALRSKQMNDMQSAALHLRHAKGLYHMIDAAKEGLPVDITKVPGAPVAENEYSLAQASGSAVSPHTSEQYNQLMELLRQQHKMCLGYSQQFTHMGNVAETVRFEKLAEECMNNIEVLRQAHGKGYPVPKFHTEERTFSTIKILPQLTNSDMVLTIVKGINLPAPSGVSTKALGTSVRFEFPFPSLEEAQKDKTSTVKNTNCPEFKEQFKLSINRSHRSLKRVIQSRGIKFEVIHKGGLFKTDKVVGSAQLKLDSLEKECEIRQLIEVLDGRKSTGGQLEVVVKIREPLGGPQVHTVAERWLVLDPITMPMVAVPKPKPQSETVKNVNASPSPPPQYKLHSINLLTYDKETLENKILDCRRSQRNPPLELLQQHRELGQRLQWQAAQVDRASPVLLAEYDSVLCRLAEGLGESVKRLSIHGEREAAKDTLGRLKMVESEMECLKRRGRPS